MADKPFNPAKPNPRPPFNRPIYHSPPPPPRSSKICSLILILLSLILLAAIAGGIFYFIYRPHRPTFSVSSLRLSPRNATSRLDLTVTARNANRRIAYYYDQISISASSNGVEVGKGSFPGFIHGAKNITVVRSSVATVMDVRKKLIDLEFGMRVRMKVGRLKTNKFGMKVFCDGIDVKRPILDSSCNVKFSMKIWKWTV